MRIPITLAWVLLAMGFSTAGLLRRYHDEIPRSPYLHPAVGSLLFFCILVLLLVAAREWRQGAVPGRGVRLGSLMPILLMLMIEKWVSLVTHSPVASWIAAADGTGPALADARFRGFAGLELLLVCLLIGRFSTPTGRKTWRRARPARWPVAAVQTFLVIGATYAALGLAARLLGGDLRLLWPPSGPLLFWIVGGQALLAFAEEVYFRGLLMSEMERLAPRMGIKSAMGRRWTALLTTSALFALEHLDVSLPWTELLRQTIFTVSLGALFGLLVMASANLHLAGAMHAWINWLLLGAAPRFVLPSGESALPAGTYIGLTLIFAFVLTFVFRRLRRRGA